MKEFEFVITNIKRHRGGNSIIVTLKTPNSVLEGLYMIKRSKALKGLFGKIKIGDSLLVTPRNEKYGPEDILGMPNAISGVRLARKETIPLVAEGKAL